MQKSRANLAALVFLTLVPLAGCGGEEGEVTVTTYQDLEASSTVDDTGTLTTTLVDLRTDAVVGELRYDAASQGLEWRLPALAQKGVLTLPAPPSVESANDSIYHLWQVSDEQLQRPVAVSTSDDGIGQVTQAQEAHCQPYAGGQPTDFWGMICYCVVVVNEDCSADVYTTCPF